MVEYIILYFVAWVLSLLVTKMYKGRVTGLDFLLISLASLLNIITAIIAFFMLIIGLMEGKAVNLPFGKSIAKILNKEYM